MTFHTCFFYRSKRCFFRVAPVLALCLWAPVSSAYIGLCCAKCGGNMPMNIMGGGIPETHEFRFKLSMTDMAMRGLRAGRQDLDTNSLLGDPAQGLYMAVPTRMHMRMLNLALGYSVSDRFFAAVMLMGMRNSMPMRFNSKMRTMTGQDAYTMRSSGLADSMLMGKYRLFADNPRFPTRQASLLLSLSIPTGSIDEKNRSHPLAMRRKEQLPYAMQLGSGTWDPGIGLLYQASRSPYWWGVNARFTARLYDNARHYRLGHQTNLDGYAMFQFRPKWLVQIQLNARLKNRIKGVMDAAQDGTAGHAVPGKARSPLMSPLWDTQKTGGSLWMTTLGLQWQPAAFHIIDLNIGLPLRQNLHGPQLKAAERIMLTWYREWPTEKSIRYQHNPLPDSSRLGF